MKKSQKIIYWVATGWLALGMVSTGTVQLIKAKDGPGGVEAMTQLGYPLYFLTLLGIWKLLGAVAVCIPKTPLLKEWAYAGFFFTMTGALFSHLASGSPTSELFPSILLLVLTGLSWYFRPASRTLQTTANA